MSTFYLINPVSLGTNRLLPGKLINDAIDPAAAIRTAGGLLWPSSDPKVATAAATCAAKHLGAGSNEVELHAIMLAAVADSEKQQLDSVVDGTVQVGTPGSQSGVEFSYQLFATTTDGGTVAVDTGYAPPSGHAAKIDGGFSCTDRTSHKSRALNVNAIVDNYGGLAVKGTPIVSGGTGDSGFTGTTLAFSVSVGGTLVVTFTPPSAYSGILDWIFSPTFAEN